MLHTKQGQREALALLPLASKRTKRDMIKYYREDSRDMGRAFARRMACRYILMCEKQGVLYPALERV